MKVWSFPTVGSSQRLVAIFESNCVACHRADGGGSIGPNLTDENWILGGSIIHWGENLFPEFDLIVFLWLPPEIRLKRLKERTENR